MMILLILALLEWLLPWATTVTCIFTHSPARWKCPSFAQMWCLMDLDTRRTALRKGNRIAKDAFVRTEKWETWNSCNARVLSERLQTETFRIHDLWAPKRHTAELGNPPPAITSSLLNHPCVLDSGIMQCSFVPNEYLGRGELYFYSLGQSSRVLIKAYS